MKRVLTVSVILVMLLAVLLPAAGCSALNGSALQTAVITANGSAYVVTDTSTQDDPQGLRDKNYSTQDFLKIWYAWDVQSTEKVISVGLTKFDLASLKGKDIKSATLQMYATRTDLAKAVRLVDVSLVDASSAWDAATVTYNTRPTWSASSVATAAVYGAGVWYSWDVTPSIIQSAKTGTASFVAGLNAMDDKTEEQALFSSAQAANGTAPRILVTYNSANASTFPWWIWVIAIVVVAIIAFFVGWLLMRARARKAVNIEINNTNN